MGIIPHLFDPSEVVYVIDVCDDHLFVKKGTVIRIRAEVLLTGQKVRYDIRLDGEHGTKDFDEADVFSSTGSPSGLTEVMAEYEARLS